MALPLSILAGRLASRQAERAVSFSASLGLDSLRLHLTPYPCLCPGVCPISLAPVALTITIIATSSSTQPKKSASSSVLASVRPLASQQKNSNQARVLSFDPHIDPSLRPLCKAQSPSTTRVSHHPSKAQLRVRSPPLLLTASIPQSRASTRSPIILSHNRPHALVFLRVVSSNNSFELSI